MDDLFGLSMNYIMLGLLAALGISLASVGYVVLRSRVMFDIGFFVMALVLCVLVVMPPIDLLVAFVTAGGQRCRPPGYGEEGDAPDGQPPRGFCDVLLHLHVFLPPP